MRNIYLPNASDDVLFVDQINEHDYRSAHGLNKTSLVKFMKSPRHYLQSLHDEFEATDSMRMGTALHSLVLRDDPTKHFAVKKKVDNRTKEGKEYSAQFEQDNKGKTIITEEQNELVQGMFKSLRKNERFSRMMDRFSHREVGIFANYNHPLGDFRIKGMLDAYIETEGLIVDIKTSQDASLDLFKWDFKKYAYGLQQVHYTHLLGKTKMPFSNFVFVVVENKPPHEVAFYTLSMNDYLKTQDEWKMSMNYFGNLHSKQDFDIGYPSETIELTY